MKIMAAELSKDLDACKLSISQLEETIGDSDTDSGKLNDNISECESFSLNPSVSAVYFETS